MAVGHFIHRGEKTTCVGVVIEGDPAFLLGNDPLARDVKRPPHWHVNGERRPMYAKSLRVTRYFATLTVVMTGVTGYEVIHPLENLK
ncbi:hypothetical protein [Pseudomonas sp. SCB32]|uniref:hypothetical protein n=1 Tax=Pseudomonas sp. SCB32 TaxID=2653853 RepID=UPI0012643F5D|nr:hypothetical protein [Pseudomonas sp. SCB32]